jgi:hypothetical protein
MLNFIRKRVFAVNTPKIATAHFSQVSFEAGEQTGRLPTPATLCIGDLRLITYEFIDLILKALQAIEGMFFKVP